MNCTESHAIREITLYRKTHEKFSWGTKAWRIKRFSQEKNDKKDITHKYHCNTAFGTNLILLFILNELLIIIMTLICNLFYIVFNLNKLLFKLVMFKMINKNTVHNKANNKEKT
jgi:hypothetical protein